MSLPVVAQNEEAGLDEKVNLELQQFDEHSKIRRRLLLTEGETLIEASLWQQQDKQDDTLTSQNNLQSQVNPEEFV